MAIETLTIAELKAKTTNTSDIYYTTDIGQEGEWYCDISDTISLENIGTIVVGTTAPFLRFKRIFDAGFVNVTWFGAKGDGVNNDTPAIQAALDFISKTDDFNPNNEAYYGGGTVFLPKGVYRIIDTLLIGQNCRLIGVNNRYHFEYTVNQNSGGTVLKAEFENTNKWVISSSTFNTQNGANMNLFLPFDIRLLKAEAPPTNPDGYNFNNYIYRMGISIENLTIDGGANVAFGGIRLANAGNSMIRNVGCFNTKCAFMLNTCWGGSIENCFSKSLWYGALIIECNSILISDSYFVGYAPEAISELIPATELPDFIYHELEYSDWDLNNNVKRGQTGIYCYNTSSLSVIATVVEATTNAISCLNSTMSLTSIHIEVIVYYGIIIGIGKDTQLIANQVFFYNLTAAFYFGKYAMAKLNSIRHNIPHTKDNQLFVYNSSEGRNITFTNTLYLKRKYFSDILFTDEGVEGQNFGAVYVNPDSGSDFNYGFNENDPVQSFDAALIRVQNQSTINPIKTIYIRAAPQGEGIDPSLGASTKELDIVSIENADLLITTYDIDVNVYPPRIKGRIYFKGDTSVDKIAMIGQVELLGNVNLYFRNIDLVCNTPFAMSLNPYNLSMFGLKNSYGRLTFNNDRIVTPPYDIDLNLTYFLVQANLDSLILLSPKSLIDIKFVNISINGGALSPNQTGNQNLGVDCIQINSNRTGLGWQDAEIIRNNF